jgi:thiamine pyrophosphate-dependent acetolactate synthase large subunit-like protein
MPDTRRKPIQNARRNEVSQHLPYVTGSLGLLGTKPSWDLMQDCDTLLMVGSAFPYSEFLPKPGTAAMCKLISRAPT